MRSASCSNSVRTRRGSVPNGMTASVTERPATRCSHRPTTRPSTSTTGDTQPCGRKTSRTCSAGRNGGWRRAPMTQGSNAGRSRYVGGALASRSSATCSASTQAVVPFTSTGTTSSPSSASNRFPTAVAGGPTHQRAMLSGVAGAYAPRNRRRTSRSACSGGLGRLVSPSHVAGAVNRTSRPWGGAKQMRPRNDAALRSEPQLERTHVASSSDPVRRPTSAASSSRVSMRPRSACPTAVQICSTLGWPLLPNFFCRLSAPSQVGRSAAGTRWSVPRAAQSLTRLRSRQSASWIALLSSFSTRASTASSAAPMTCACRPHNRPATSATSSAPVRVPEKCRLTRHANASRQPMRTNVALPRGEKTERVSGRVEHDPHALLRLLFGQRGARLLRPRHGGVEVVDRDVEVSHDLLLTRDAGPGRADIVRFDLEVQRRQTAVVRRPALRPVALGLARPTKQRPVEARQLTRVRRTERHRGNSQLRPLHGSPLPLPVCQYRTQGTPHLGHRQGRAVCDLIDHPPNADAERFDLGRREELVVVRHDDASAVGAHGDTRLSTRDPHLRVTLRERGAGVLGGVARRGRDGYLH